MVTVGRIPALLVASLALATSFMIVDLWMSQSGTYGYFADRVTTSGTFEAGYWVTPLPTAAATPTPEPIVPVVVDFKPEALNEGSNGSSVLAFVTLPSGYDVGTIPVDSIRLCIGTNPCGTSGVPAQVKRGLLGDDVEGDLKTEGKTITLKVVFDRQAVIAMLQETGVTEQATMTVSGQIGSPVEVFAGSDTVNLIGSDGMPLVPALGSALAAPTVGLTTPVTASGTPTPTVTGTPTSLAATATWTPGATPTGTVVPTLVVPTWTDTVAPTETATAVPSATSTPTLTPSPTATPTGVPTPTPTFTTTATETPVPTATATYTPTLSPTATRTAIPSPTVTYTATPLPTATYTATAVPTATYTPVPSPTRTPVP